MDTIRLEFELTQEERRQFWARAARMDSRVRRLTLRAMSVGALVAAPVLLLLSYPDWALALLMTGVVGLLIDRLYPYTEERALRQALRRLAWGHRAALWYVQSLQIDALGVRSTRRGLLGVQKLEWSATQEAARATGHWYFRSGGTQFIIPDRAFPTTESLAQFEAVVRERVPPQAWRADADQYRGR